ncbi:precorrin-3B C(17)-methyltransferase [Pelagibius litoralis]|uniref:Precorrin-3B C(17)-methyltransferase n=1 Tax=Pelagibius litoralis TaxID=374515 RepID=A0A967C5J8_9PROT|nr:precorrin-3B C(17)-methyltransferase [Pelagibius litoralis]NIA69159.1 precorrin-3B C(17)-methyltransferase [Pelagibius litoralis]
MSMGESAAALVVLTPGGAELAARLKTAVPTALVYGRAGRVASADVVFEDFTATLQAAFLEGRAIIGIAAAGTLIRALAPLLADKRAEPPVIAVAEDGSAVVPLLGGHRGANDLAKRLAGILEIEAAVTTAGDRRFGVALDAPPAGWRLGNPENYKGFAAALLSGETLKLRGDADWLAQSSLPFSENGGLAVQVTETRGEPGPHCLVYHPAVLALGVGCERDCEAAELAGLVESTLAAAGLSHLAVAGVFSIDVKADEAAVLDLAARLDVPARFFDAVTLEAEAPRLANPSDLVFREVGCHGVAEGAALAAAGAGAKLVVAKTKSRRATCAVALAPGVIDVQNLGRARGSLCVVGTGPGDPVWRTPEVEAAVLRASDLVGYGLYLDLLGPLASGKARHGYELGEEEQRVRVALDLAAEGKDVALVCSGDPGIYAMATLVFELLERGEDTSWQRIDIKVMPGVSALQAAAARAGAPLGHDFCTISLSDLLTPWPAIEQRVEAAAAGDFVIAFYNPVSKRRTRQLAAAVEILKRHRPADTPVILARNLGRDGETLKLVDLAELTPDMVDMLTVVLVGSSETRRVARSGGGHWVYTPRGYAAKAKKKSEDAA